VTASRPVRVFLNYLHPGKPPAWVKRLGIVVEKGEGLTFDYEKVAAEEELLALTLFRAHGVLERSSVRVRLAGAPARGPGPFSTWTFRDRVYDVRPAEGDPVPVLGARDESVDPGQPFYFPLGNDLPPGRYRFTVDLERGPGGYLVLTRSIPGAYERRDFFEEQPYRFGGPAGK
jgi:hypothetical protein